MLDPGFEATDREWEDILKAIRLQADDLGISTQDFPEMLTLIKRMWDLLQDSAQRKQQIDHLQNKSLPAAASKARQHADDLDGEVAKLPPDPGPARP